MTKAELIERIARSRDLPPEVSKKAIAKVLDAAFAELAAYFVRSRLTRNTSPRFTFPKFGTFTKKKRQGRRGVNPRTLEPIDIEPCDTLDFKPSAELKRQMNEASGQRSAKGKSPAKAKPKPKPKAKPKTKKKAARTSAKATAVKAKRKRAAGPQGRKLLTREDADLELSSGDTLLPEAPLQRASVRRSRLAGTGSDSGSGSGSSS